MSLGWDALFGGVIRLLGGGASARLRAAHVLVVGVGGVGSWVAEALGRTGVGCLTLVDGDEVCASNVNRQVQARRDTIGLSKVEVMADRLRSINRDVDVRPVRAYFNPETADEVLAVQADAVVDATDDTANKCLLLARCRAGGRWILTSGGAGGRRDPTRLRTADLAHTSHDVLLQLVRRRLRQEHGFPTGTVPFGIRCVYSTERPVHVRADGTVGLGKAEPGKAVERGSRSDSGLGTAVFVTGSLGLLAAAETVRHLVGSERV